MGEPMSNRRIAAAAILLAGLTGPAFAKSLPAVKMASSNQPWQCTTPGRLMAFIRARNPRLLRKFSTIATEYKRHGEDLGVRWDYAFYQMVVETNSLKFTGDVKPYQNNFAGLGATGGGVRGEKFRTVSDGVRAHLQHLMIYAGIYVTDPVADRTRKVQSWRILDKWRKRIRGDVTYGDVGSKWAPYDRGYSNDIEAIAVTFKRSHCNQPDLDPASQTAGNTRFPKGRTALGAASTIGRNANAQRRSNSGPAYKTLNARTKITTPNTSRDAHTATSSQKRRTSLAKFAAPSIKPPARVNKCRVWTASYGGKKATIIRSTANSTTNYTVLDVNAGRESAETKAYIAAYAKGGKRIGDFPTKSAAMTKAFQLCPEN